MTEPTRISHWIDGKPFGGVAERTGEVHDPATGALTGRVDFATAEVMDEAVAAAKAAFAEWGRTSLTKRAQVMFAFRELLNERKEELAAIITAEHGKVLSDALGEVTRGLEVVEFACGIPHLLKGGYSEGVSTGVDVYSIRQPLGVVGIISPFNFPAMVPMWFFPVAIAAGNTVILKPSEKDPSAANWIAALWAEAGLPAGVFNVVHGDKVAVDSLLTHKDVKSISFVGSTAIARYVYETGTANGKRVQALGGAKNHMVVLPDADLDLAADAAVNAGFGSAGERCMAISALVAVGTSADPLVEKIKERMAGLRTGDGRRGCDMGPLVTEVHRDKVKSYVRRRRPRPRRRRRARRLLARPHAHRQRHHRHVGLHRRDLRPGSVGRPRRLLRRGPEARQRPPVRQRHRDLHQRRRCRSPLPERGRGRHGRHQRADPRAHGVLLLRRLEVLAVRRHPRPRHRGRALLHPRQGRHLPLARPEPRRDQPRLPDPRLSARRTKGPSDAEGPFGLPG
jgi:methylmalonic acid semialdehyde dehydrogenase